MQMGIIVTNMGNEMFNDGLYYAEQALASENKFTKWRYCRSAIISFCAAAEAEIAKLITKALEEKIGRLTKEQRTILTFLREPNARLKYIPLGLQSNRRKYNLLCSLRCASNKSFDTKYESITQLRNKIIHYSTSHHQAVYSETLLLEVQNARKTIASYILSLYSISNMTPPSWIEATESREIQ